MKKHLGHISTAVFAICLVVWGCKSGFDKVVPQITSTDSLVNSLKTPKILILVADGARGQSVRESQPPIINALTQNATYSWFSLSDALANDASSWTDMFTGVAKEKHGVLNNTFVGNKFTDYPLVFQRVKTALPGTRIATFSFTGTFANNLNAGTDASQALNTDLDVKNSVVGELGNSNAGIVVGVFGGINTAGATYGYDSSVPQYKAAILQFDSYVGEAWAAIKARKSYSKENWMIIVTSSRGGSYPVTGGDGTIFSNPQANTFTIIYNADYKIKYIDKPYTGNKYSGSFINISGGTNSSSVGAIRAEMLSNAEVFKLAKKEYTIELKVKKNPGASNNYIQIYPAFFGTRQTKGGVGGGWAFVYEGTANVSNTWRFVLGSATGAANIFVNGTDIRDGNWHNLAVKVYNEGTKRYMATYTDGLPTGNKTEIVSTFIEGDSTNPVTIGWTSGSTTDLTNRFDGYLSDIRIWLAALPDATIAQFSCDVQVTSAHPYYNSLAGYWPCNEGSGNKFKDQGSLGNDFTLVTGGNTSPYVTGTILTAPFWTPLTSIICPPSNTNLGTYVPNTKDVTAQILSWMGILPADTWKLDGRTWLNQ